MASLFCFERIFGDRGKLKWICEGMDGENNTVASRVEFFDADIGMLVLDSEVATDSDSNLD